MGSEKVFVHQGGSENISEMLRILNLALEGEQNQESQKMVCTHVSFSRMHQPLGYLAQFEVGKRLCISEGKNTAKFRCTRFKIHSWIVNL